LKNKIVILAIVLTALLSVASTYGVLSYLNAQKFAGTMTLRENMFVVYELMHGLEEFELGNVITDIGENITCFSIFSNVSSILDLAVGNATGTLQTKTALDAVYNDPTDGEYVTATLSDYWFNGGDLARNMTFKWTFEETVNLDAAASYNSNLDAYNMANFVGGAQTFNNNENLTVRMVFTFDAND